MEKKQRVLILDKEHIGLKLRRMAYEIWERNADEQNIVLIGIEKGGKILADNLTELLREISPLEVTTLSLQINKKEPLTATPPIACNLTGKSVIIVDDVANSGKTIIYSLQSILSYNLKKLTVAVLVDRKHKSFPISATIVGLSVSTTLQDHIEVETEGKEIMAVYLQ